MAHDLPLDRHSNKILSGDSTYPQFNFPVFQVSLPSVKLIS